MAYLSCGADGITYKQQAAAVNANPAVIDTDEIDHVPVDGEGCSYRLTGLGYSMCVCDFHEYFLVCFLSGSKLIASIDYSALVSAGHQVAHTAHAVKKTSSQRDSAVHDFMLPIQTNN